MVDVALMGDYYFSNTTVYHQNERTLILHGITVL
jgi:hypothetical protein